jgi:PAS domain S-box-containing protein
MLDKVSRLPMPASAVLGRAFRAWDGLIEFLPIGVCVCGRDGHVAHYNRRAEELWGRAPFIEGPDVRYCGTYKAYLPTGMPLPPSQSPAAEALAARKPVRDRELIVERPDGSRSWILVNADPLFDDDEEIVGAVSCFQDITELKRAQEELRASEHWYRELLQALPAAVYTTDAAGRITFFNEAAAAMSGRRPQLDADEWCVTWKLYRPDGSPLPHDECPMAIALKENRPVRGDEAIAERPDGSRVPFMPYPTPLRDADGTLIGAVNVLVDISERKRAESQQKALVDELHHRVKNNMQALAGLIRASQRETASEEARQVLEDASKRVDAMAVAHQALYRADDLETVDGRELIGRLCTLVQRGFGAGLEITTEAQTVDLPNDAAVPVALILNELLTNAAKHAQNGRGRVCVRVRLCRGGEELVLGVRDDGPGFQFADTGRRASGLGLVCALAEQIGGRFEADTRTGACFTLRFPRRRPDAAVQCSMRMPRQSSSR